MQTYAVTPGDNTIAIEHRDKPALGPRDICVKVEAVSLNYRDIITRKVTKRPVVPCSDGAGEVVAVGDDVVDFSVGDNVLGLFFPSWKEGVITAEDFAVSRGAGKCDGMLSEYIVGDAAGFLAFPEYLSAAQAATLPCAGVTAWHALMETETPVKAGDTVLLQGTGGVSIFALQLCKLMGVNTLVISSSDEKLERVKRMGATHTLNYKKQPEWAEAALDMTGGRGVDRVIEVGGAGTLTQSMQAASYGAIISLIGILSGIKGEINPFPILTKSLRVQGIYVASKAMQQRFHQFLSEHKLQPVIDSLFSFEQANDAYEYQLSGQHFGKIVVKVS